MLKIFIGFMNEDGCDKKFLIRNKLVDEYSALMCLTLMWTSESIRIEINNLNYSLIIRSLNMVTLKQNDM